VSIDVNCVFEGDDARRRRAVGPNCVIRNASIGAGTRIDAFTHIDGAQLGANTVIGRTRCAPARLATKCTSATSSR
jgi:bifunctional UDP-N-acetylglucosamine pyrophosphorylase/glucosamine-1-phosphate N-acetyltransferase